MTRTVFRLALPLILLFTAALFIIRAQPYKHHAISALLFSDECPAPCFMGIRPGVTTPEEALARLHDSEWITRVGVSEPLETVAWRWSTRQTAIMDNERLPGLFYDRNRVRLIRLYTQVRLGDLLLELGGTSGRRRAAIGRDASFSRYHAIVLYAAHNYVIGASVSCHQFWEQPANLILGIAPQSVDGLGRLTYGLNRARRIVAVTCRRLKEL